MTYTAVWITIGFYVPAVLAAYFLFFRSHTASEATLSSRIRVAGGYIARRAQRVQAAVAAAAGSAGRAGGAVASACWSEKWKFAAIGGVALIPVAVTLSIGHIRLLDRLQGDSPMDDNPVVMALLKGEQLVPPPPLPPAVFTTRDVLMARPAIDKANRDWSLLDAEFRQRLLYLFRYLELNGYQPVLLEGYRSPERQDTLAGAGAQVTNARAFQSYHQYGLAADVAFLRNGHIVISEKDPWAMAGYELYGREAEALGLTWGGRWRMADFGHVELRRKGVLGRNDNLAEAAEQGREIPVPAPPRDSDR